MIKLVQRKIALAPEEITRLLIKLENQDKLHFRQKTAVQPSSFQAYVFSKRSIWYWIIIAVSIIAVLTVFAIPDSLYPALYIRYVLGIVLILFLPGYAFIKMLFPFTLPIHTNSKNMDAMEGVALGIGMSLMLAMIVGLIFNYTQFRLC